MKIFNHECDGLFDVHSIKIPDPMTRTLPNQSKFNNKVQNLRNSGTLKPVEINGGNVLVDGLITLLICIEFGIDTIPFKASVKPFNNYAIDFDRVREFNNRLRSGQAVHKGKIEIDGKLIEIDKSIPVVTKVPRSALIHEARATSKSNFGPKKETSKEHIQSGSTFPGFKTSDEVIKINIDKKAKDKLFKDYDMLSKASSEDAKKIKRKFIQQGGKCYLCGHNITINREFMDDLDIAIMAYKMPLYLGGTDDESNKVLICRCCDELKGDLMINDKLAEVIREQRELEDNLRFPGRKKA